MRARISEVGLRQLGRYVMPVCGLLIRCALSSLMRSDHSGSISHKSCESLIQQCFPSGYLTLTNISECHNEYTLVHFRMLQIPART